MPNLEHKSSNSLEVKTLVSSEVKVTGIPKVEMYCLKTVMRLAEVSLLSL